jgi:hypothetical protein
MKEERRRFTMHSEGPPVGSAPQSACGGGNVTCDTVNITHSCVIGNRFVTCLTCGAPAEQDINCLAEGCPGLEYCP